MSVRPLLTLLAALAAVLPGPVRGGEGLGRAIPFTLHDLQGQPVRLEEQLARGPVLLSFWATWCAACKQELHDLKPVYARFAPQGFSALAISIDPAENHAAVLGYARSAELPYRVLRDTDSAVIARYQPSLATPFSVLIDRDGRVVLRHEGHAGEDVAELVATLEALLAPAVAAPASPATVAAPAADAPAHDHDAGDVAAALDDLAFGGRWEFRGAVREPAVIPPINGWLVDFRSQLHLDAGYAGFFAHGDASLRQLHFLDRAVEQVLGQRELNRIALEKITVGYRGETFGAEAGDVRGVWARGLGLSLRREDQYGLDTTLRGGRVTLDLRTRTSVELLGGVVNPLPYVGTEDRKLDFPVDGYAFGGRVGQGIGGHIDFGAFALLSRFDPGEFCDALDPSEFLLVGGEAALRPTNGWVSLYWAGAFLDRDCLLDQSGWPAGLPPPAPDTRNGWGTFGELNLLLGPVTVFGEAKYYDHFQVRDPLNPEAEAVLLIDPPTFEPLEQELKQNHDLWGVRAGLRARLFDGAQLEAWMNRAESTNYRGTSFDIKPVSYQAWLAFDYHGPAGSALRHLRAVGGYRHETQLDDVTGKRFLEKRIGNAGLELGLRLVGPHELHAHVTTKLLAERFGYDEDAVESDETTATLSYNLAGWLDLGVIYGHSTRRPDTADHYGAGTVSLRWTDWEVKALGGTMFGGRRCVGGVCRDMPDFTGFKLEVVRRF